MKCIWALAGALALSACGSEPDLAPSVESQAAEAPMPQPDAIAGIYGANGVDGEPWTSELAADGTYRNTIAGQVSEAGTWSNDGGRLCFMPDAPAATPAPQGQPAAGATCLTVVEVGADGSLLLSDEAGNRTTAPRLPGSAQPVAPAPQG